MFASLNVYLKNRFCGQVSWESERNREPELAPMYDAVSTLVYPDLSRDFAMSIGESERG